jgi:hypothetical protein
VLELAVVTDKLVAINAMLDPERVARIDLQCFA